MYMYMYMRMYQMDDAVDTVFQTALWAFTVPCVATIGAGLRLLRQTRAQSCPPPRAAPGCLTWKRDVQPTKLTSKNIKVDRRVNVPSPAAAPSQERMFYQKTLAQARVVHSELAANWVVLEANGAIEGVYPPSKLVAIRRIKQDLSDHQNSIACGPRSLHDPSNHSQLRRPRSHQRRPPEGSGHPST